MFDKLKSLVSQLENSNWNFSKYAQARDARKLLQEVKVNASALRKEILAAFKENKNK